MKALEASTESQSSNENQGSSTSGESSGSEGASTSAGSVEGAAAAGASGAADGDGGAGGAGAASETGAAGEGQTGDGVTPPAYSPNYKFKVGDQEQEIPEYLRGVIKDVDTEKKIKELHEKALGLELAKPRHLALQERYKAADEELGSLKDGLQELGEMYRGGDLDGFFARLKIPHEKILNWVAEKIRYQELPEDQRQIMDRERAARDHAKSLEKRVSHQEQLYQEQISHAKGYALGVSLERAEIKSFAASFDAKAGKPGAFRDAVIDVGDNAFRNGTDLTPEQAIEATMSWYGKFLPPQAANNTQAGTPGAGTQAPATRQTPPVIPNVSGRTTSPTGTSKPKSIDDLKKLSAQMAASRS